MTAARNVTATTTVAGVIGSPIRHSLSPTIHNAGFDALGLDWVFAAFDIPAGEAPSAVSAARALRFGGLSVTMPHKSAVITELDGVTDVATRLGAVNCIYPESGRLIGDNTDGAGLLAGIRREWALDVAGAHVVVIGSGGAAAAAVEALARAGADHIGIVGRNSARVEAVSALGGPKASPAEHRSVNEADVVINATPVGMEGHDGVPTPERPRVGSHVIDLIYHPSPTAWMVRCAADGAHVMGGVPMLLGQAEIAFEKWTGVDAPHDAMELAVADAVTVDDRDIRRQS